MLQSAVWEHRTAPLLTPNPTRCGRVLGSVAEAGLSSIVFPGLLTGYIYFKIIFVTACSGAILSPHNDSAQHRTGAEVVRYSLTWWCMPVGPALRRLR